MKTEWLPSAVTPKSGLTASTGKFEFCEAACAFRSAFESKYRSGKLTDVQIHIGDKVFSAHRIVLSAVFPYFDTVFELNTKNSRKVKITLRNIDPDAFECLLDFAYTAKISVDNEKVKQLLVAANYLKHAKVREACVEFLSAQFTPENVLELRTFGYSVNCYEFVNKADTFIGQKFERVLKTKAFLNASFELVSDIVSRTDIEVKETENVYKAISSWLKADSERTNKFMDLVICVGKKLPIKRRTDSRKAVYTSDVLLDTTLANEDAFGIYAISACNPYNRIVHNYNPYTSSWSRIAQHKQPRSFMSVVSGCGLIFAFTGDNLEVFDRSSWRPHGILPWQVKNRSGNAVSLGSKIYWFPNVLEDVRPVWCFDVKSAKWEEEVPSVKLHNPGVVSLESYIYILGGFKSSELTAEAMIYDPQYKIFQHIPPMLVGRAGPPCAALNGKVYVCGGCGVEPPFTMSAEVYEPLWRKWLFISPMTTAWTDFSVVPCEGKLYLIGRHSDKYSSVEIYDPDKNEWKSGPKFPDRCESLKALVLSV